MIKLEDINSESWGEILKSNSPDDIETIRFLQEHEEEILNILIENSEEKNIDEKRREYIKKIIYKPEDKIEVITKIEEIREKYNYSILQFGKRLPGSSYLVYEFGDKIIKLGKYYKVLNDPNILQPEFQMIYGQDNECITIYERLKEVFSHKDYEIAQEMYNRIRDNNILWFDVIGDNVGRTDKRRDDNDDGLRIIDAQYMEYERDVLLRIDPERNERYKNMGLAMYKISIRDYITEKFGGFNEQVYQEMVEERRKKATQQEIEVVAKQSSISGLQKVKEFFSNLFHRKESDERDDK